MKVVIRSKCSRDSKRQDRVNTSRYMVRNRCTPRTFRSGKVLPSNRMVDTALGCSIRRISPMEARTKITSRATLMPPPVDPAQAPMNISVTRIALEKVGQVLKSTVA